jgi:predicted DNA-binding protein (UPF0251 family)
MALDRLAQRGPSIADPPTCLGIRQLSLGVTAALILRDVLGFSAAEVAQQLGMSTASVNSALQRARQAIDSAAPTQQTVLRDLGGAAVDGIVTRWADAWQAGDVDAIVAMLADDARYSMPPLPEWYQGRDEIRAFLLRDPLRKRWRFLPTTANGQIAFGTYLWDDAAGGTFPAVSTSSRCSTNAWPTSSPSSTPTSPDSGCRSASVRRRVQNWRSVRWLQPQGRQGPAAQSALGMA